MKIKKESILLLLIMVVAAFLRFYNLSYTEFKGDQALNLYLGLDLIKHNFLTQQTLLSSVGSYNSPLFHYLLSLPLILSKNPVFVSGFIALLNTLSVLICYFLVKKIASSTAGFLAALFYAINPWAILYSRHLWHQNALPFFVLLFIYALVVFIQNKKSSWLILASTCMAIATQLHLSALSLIILFLIVLIWQRKNIKPLHFIISLFVFILIYAPYLIFEFSHHYYNLQKYWTVMHLPFRFHLDALFLPWQLATTLGFESYLGNQLPIILTHPLHLIWLDIVFLLGLLTSFAYFIFHRPFKKEFWILILWFVLPTIFLLFNKTPLYNHYFIIFFPLPFIFFALLVNNILKKIKSHKLVLMFLCFNVLMIFLYQFLYSFTFLNTLKQRQCFQNEYGPTLQYQLNTVKTALQNGEKNLDKIYEQTCACSPNYCTLYNVQYLIDYLNGNL